MPFSSEYIYDWNTHENEIPQAPKQIKVLDETLRDGLQSTSALHPLLDERMELVHLMDALGISTVNLGYPGSSPRSKQEVALLARETLTKGLNIKPQAVARTLTTDVRPIVESSQIAGLPIEAGIFIGSSEIRHLVENWNIPQMCTLIENAVSFGVKHEIPVLFVLEDTTRAQPEHLKTFYRVAIDAGASRICLADTAGHATPEGTRAQVTYIRRWLDEIGSDVGLDWHGHRDRGLSTANALVAAAHGADRIHATALGLGERAGNTAMEELLVNLRLLGYVDNDLSKLEDYAELVARATNTPIVYNQPIVGKDAFSTATGVHAAAVIKARKMGHEKLSHLVYSSVPADLIGRDQVIKIGPFSGMHNVRVWMEEKGLAEDTQIMEAILDLAKDARGILNDDQIWAAVNRVLEREGSAAQPL